jgi:hypothetical protein
VYIIIIFAFYFVGGYVYNNKKNGSTGFDALPHSEFWMDFPKLIIEGFRFTAKKFTSLVKNI